MTSFSDAWVDDDLVVARVSLVVEAGTSPFFLDTLALLSTLSMDLFSSALSSSTAASSGFSFDFPSSWRKMTEISLAPETLPLSPLP